MTDHSKIRANLGCEERVQKYTNTCIGLWRAFMEIHKYVYWAAVSVSEDTQIRVLGCSERCQEYTNTCIGSERVKKTKSNVYGDWKKRRVKSRTGSVAVLPTRR